MKDLELLNADGLDESITGKYSNQYFSADGDDDDTTDDSDAKETENEDSVEHENEDKEVADAGDPVDPADLPKFRTLVKNKKSELKAKYGKFHLSLFSCGFKPLPAGIAHPDVLCIWNCGKSKNHNKPCCVKNREQAQKRAAQNRKINDWDACHAQHKGLFVWGWRRKWREFKKQGGLKQLKAQSKGLAPIPSSTPSAPTPAAVPKASTPVQQKVANVPVLNLPKLNLGNDVSKKNLIVNPKGVVSNDADDSSDDTSTTPTSGSKVSAKKNPVSSNGKSKVSDKNKSTAKTDTTTGAKFLGMPKNIGIGVTVFGGIALLTIGYLALRKK